ncbi:cobalamin-binding protein [Tahibacter sp.]|uniref:cobalamin-binding protein n=1 Tax=Tahibacter sp. TaxID=2056211 RepID=UPI0028C4B25F|nr:cobalamin-binding protein [Tahibacter sp.]
MPRIATFAHPIARMASCACACVIGLALSTLPIRANADTGISVIDDSGRTVTLNAPAHRIVSLAPSTTELLFAAGAGRYVVGTSSYSDYPPEATQIAQVGDAAMINMERIVSLKPDLIIVWSHVDSAAVLEKLQVLGIPVYYSEPRRIADIAKSIIDMGTLAGTTTEATRVADQLSGRIGALRRKYAGRPPIRVFYQVWERPLMTINGQQMISDAIELCGGVNIFGGLAATVPTVNREAVVAANPDVIVTYDGETEDALSGWKTLTTMHATAWGNLVALSTPALGRPSPRFLEGAENLCIEFDRARARRPAAK